MCCSRSGASSAWLGSKGLIATKAVTIKPSEAASSTAVALDHPRCSSRRTRLGGRLEAVSLPMSV